MLLRKASTAHLQAEDVQICNNNKQKLGEKGLCPTVSTYLHAMFSTATKNNTDMNIIVYSQL